MMFSSLIVIFGSLQTISASQLIELQKKKTECTDGNTGKVHQVDDVWKVKGKCLQRVCKKEEDGVSIQSEGCPTVMQDDNCKILEQKQKSFPECCPKVVGCKGKGKNKKGKKKKGKKKKGKGKGNKKKGKGKKSKGMGKKSKRMSGGDDYALNPQKGKKKNGKTEKEKKLPDGDDYSVFSDAGELFKEQIETKIIDGKRYFNPKKKESFERKK